MTTIPPTHLKTHDDLIKELDLAIKQNLIQIGDIILYGLDKDMLSRVLLDCHPSGSQLPITIGYITLRTGSRWYDVVSHASIVAEVDPNIGIESLVVIEGGTDNHTGFAGLMKHKLLYYLDPKSVRNIRIVRSGRGNNVNEKDRKIILETFNQITQQIPFLSSKIPYPINRKVDPNDHTIPPLDSPPMSIGKNYNQYQLLQFAATVARANPDDKMFTGILALMLKLQRVQSYQLQHPIGSYFCSQAVAQICLNVSIKLKNEYGIIKSPFNLPYSHSFFEGVPEVINSLLNPTTPQDNNMMNQTPTSQHILKSSRPGHSPEERVTSSQGESDDVGEEEEGNEVEQENQQSYSLDQFQWPVLEGLDNTQIIQMAALAGEVEKALEIFEMYCNNNNDSDNTCTTNGTENIESSFVGSVTDKLFNWVAASALQQIKDDIITSLTNQLKITDRNQFLHEIELVKKDREIIELNDKLTRLGVNHDMINKAINTHAMNPPSIPTPLEMKRYETTPCGYVSPSDFSPQQHHQNGNSENDGEIHSVFEFW